MLYGSGMRRLIIVIFLFACNTLSAQSNWKESVLSYINGLSKNDGGYGWKDQPDAHLTPTFAVVGILHDLNQLPSEKKRRQLINFISTHHPQFGTNEIPALEYKLAHKTQWLSADWVNGSEAGPSGSVMRNLIYQQIQAILWLGGSADMFKPLVSKWQSQAGNIANYEQHDYPVLFQEMMTPVCRSLLYIPLSDSAGTLAYLNSRRRANGSFNNAPASTGGDGNILNTYWSLYALAAYHKINDQKAATIKWLQSCQLHNGGFTHQPHPEIGGNDEAAYTWAAVKALALLGAKPMNEKNCIQYLMSLRNADGGFGNRPGLPSTPMSTYYAIDALKTLNALAYLDKTTTPIRSESQKRTDYAGLHIYSVQFEAPGVGSPAEAVMLADSLHIQLWGAKNDQPGWLAEAQKIADQEYVPVTFFIADEPYGKYVHVPGMGSFSHILDFIAPANVSIPQMKNDLSWAEYRKTFVEPLLKDNGALLLQISNNEPSARMILDESTSKGGYAAISTIHFNQDFLFWDPFLYQYRYQYPFVSLQDAHGKESWWWSGELIGYRTLFLAKEPTYAAMMKALKNNWIVAVRHDSLSKYKTRILGGAPGVRQYVLAHQDQWKWWEKPEQLEHPWAAITIVWPEDSFEVTRPVKGVNIRLRPWWHTDKFVLKYPIVKLVQLSIDNKILTTTYVEKKGRDNIIDSYYWYHLPSLSKGKHQLKAELINIKTGEKQVMEKQFIY